MRASVTQKESMRASVTQKESMEKSITECENDREGECDGEEMMQRKVKANVDAKILLKSMFTLKSFSLKENVCIMYVCITQFCFVSNCQFMNVHDDKTVNSGDKCTKMLKAQLFK